MPISFTILKTYNGGMLLKQWQMARRLPWGQTLFSLSLRWFVPYTGKLGATVMELSPGRCRVRLKDRRGVRNHLNSVHAIALANLAEMTSGLAMVSALPSSHRAILVELKIQYLKKARGTLMASADLTLPALDREQEVLLPVSVRNSEGEVVCSAQASWKIGPNKKA